MNHLDRKISQCMSPVKTVVYEHETIEEALVHLRERHICDKILYFYVVDRDDHLKGMVSTRDLLLKEPQTLIANITSPNIITLHAEQTLKEAMEMMEVQRLLALPVIDDQKKLLGTVDVSIYLSEAVDVANTKKRVQIFQMLGFILEEGKPFSIMKNYKIRMPWIFCNMFGGVACAVISNMYEAVLEKALILAMFIPLVLSLSESISMQAMTQSLSQTSAKFSKRLFFIQWKLYCMLALTCSVLIGSIAILWKDGLMPAFVIGLGILIAVILSASIGALIPFMLNRLKLDPKIAAGPVVLMMADILTTIIYLGLAQSLLMH